MILKIRWDDEERENERERDNMKSKLNKQINKYINPLRKRSWILNMKNCIVS